MKSSAKSFDGIDCVRRAFAAYFRGVKPGVILDQPASGGSGVETCKRKGYVVLRNVHSDVLAVYRILNSDPLKRLRRYPKAFSK